MQFSSVQYSVVDCSVVEQSAVEFIARQFIEMCGFTPNIYSRSLAVIMEACWNICKTFPFPQMSIF